MPPGLRSSVWAKYSSKARPRKKLKPRSSAIWAGDGAVMAMAEVMAATIACYSRRITRLFKPFKSQPQGIRNHRDRAQAHRRRCDDRAEEEAEHRIEHAGGEWNSEHVIDEGEHQVLPDVAHGGAAQ